MKKSSKIISSLLMVILSVSCSAPSQQKVDHNEVPEINFENLGTVVKLDKSKLYKVEDQEILRQLFELFPDSQGYIDQTREGNSDVFQAIIPLEVSYNIEKEIMDIKKGENTNSDAIKKYVDIFKSDISKITDLSKYFTDVNTYLRLALRIVSTYLFDEVSTELDSLKGDIQKIKEYQEREFKSITLTSHSRIKEISVFTSEIVENEELRARNLENLEHIKGDVIQQINQVNLAMTDTLEGELSDFKEYVTKIDEETILIEYQSVLINMLGEISKLMSILSKGNLSDEFSYSTYNAYIESANKARAELRAWHEIQIEEFGIDLLNKKVKKEGISAIISYIPGVFNKDWRKRELDDKFIEVIKEQTKEIAFVAEKPQMLSGENVKIIIMDGMVYYWHP